MKFLITGDRHLREDCPVARLDDYWAAQQRKIDFINKLQADLNLIVLDAGDIFDHWKPSPRLLAWAIDHTALVASVPGNHDLPQHNVELIDRCGFGVLESSGVVNGNDITSIIPEDIELTKVHWGGKIPKPEPSDKFKILICHHLVYQSKPPYPGAEKEGSMAKAFLRAYKYDLVVSGHNHQTVFEEYEGRFLINPGSMMRMTATQIDHKPCVYTFDTELPMNVDQYFLPIEEGVVSREHIEHTEERDARVDAFLTRLKDDVELKLSYRDNLQKYMDDNGIRGAVKSIVWKALDGNNESASR